MAVRELVANVANLPGIRMLTNSGSGRTELLGLQVAAKVLGITVTALMEYVEEGELDVIEVGGELRVVRADVAALWGRLREKGTQPFIH